MTTTAMTPFAERQAIKLGDYDPAKYNVLIPGQMTTQISPYLRPVARQVALDADPEHGDVYPITQRKQGSTWVATEVGISAVGLAKFGSVGGVLDVPQASGRVDDGRNPALVTYRAMKAMRLPDGEWRVVTRECTIKLATIEKEIRELKTKKGRENKNYSSGKAEPWSDDRIEGEIRKELLLKEKFMERLAETGATNRCYRALFAIRTKYSPAEIAKPFVIAAIVPDVNQPELRERLLDQATSASAAVFGPGQATVGAAPRQLTSSAPTEAATEVEGGELTPEELGAAETIDTTTGEVIAEPDWATTSTVQKGDADPDDGQEPTKGMQLVIVLRERAEASQTKGAATQVQRDQLKAALRGMGQPTVMTVLTAAWELKAPGDITATQAEAILDHAEGRPDFQEQWKAAAAELAGEAST